MRRLAFGIAAALGLSSPSIAAPTANDSAVAAWRTAVTASAHHGGGCYEANYPDTAWRPIACGSSKYGPTPRAPVFSVTPPGGRRPRPLDESTSGNRTALSAGIISSATGTFPQIFYVTQAAGFGFTNSFTIQLNTNGFAAPLCKKSHNTGCVGGEQFVIDSGGSVNIQTWLINYLDNVTTTCPNKTWAVSNNSAGVGVSCWQRAVQTNSKTNDLPVHVFNQLQGVTLQGIAASNGQDSLVLTVGGKATTISIPANFNFGLAGNWTDVDFNVYGESNDQVVFNTGAVVNVLVSVTDNVAASPTCAGQGIGNSRTVETSNLTLGPCVSFPTVGALSHGITFWEGVPPVVTNVQPASGVDTGGTLVTIDGQGLSKNLAVKFGGTYASDISGCNGSTVCQVYSPPGAGIVPITVANVSPVGGEGPFSTDLTQTFRYKPTPTGTMSPSSGPAPGGVTVQLRGAHFSTVSGATAVTFAMPRGPTPAADVVCASTVSCTFTAPPFAAALHTIVAVPVSVTVDGVVGSVGAFTYLISKPPPPPTPISCRQAGLGYTVKNGVPVCVGVAK